MALDRRRTMARARRGLPNDNPPPPTRGSTFPRKLFDDNRPRAVIRAERSTEQQERLDAIRQKARQSGRTAESTEAFIREFMGGMELNATQRVILDKLLFGSGVLRAGTPYRPVSLVRVGDKIVMDNETYTVTAASSDEFVPMQPREPNIKALRLGDRVRFVVMGAVLNGEEPEVKNGRVSSLWADGFQIDGTSRGYRYVEVDVLSVDFWHGHIHMSTMQKMPVTRRDRAMQMARALDQRLA